jgi:hypothetical protein
VFDRLRRWWDKRIAVDPFPNEMTITIPKGVQYVTYTIGKGGGGGGSGGGRGGDPIVVIHDGPTMWPADDDSG